MNPVSPKRKWHWQFSLISLFGFMTVVALYFGIAPIVRIHLAVRALSNEDVDVHFGYGGLRLDIHGSAAEQLKRFGTRSNEPLERALADPNKFAAAHVLLTEINQIDWE